jgi:hypothetical protein
MRIPLLRIIHLPICSNISQSVLTCNTNEPYFFLQTAYYTIHFKWRFKGKEEGKKEGKLEKENSCGKEKG